MSSSSFVQTVIQGTVVHGRKIGRKLGFPTANIDSHNEHLEKGVYGVRVRLNEKEYTGIMNVGVKPTFESNLSKTIEVHLLDFVDDIYGESLECHVLFKVRNEQKFPSIVHLKQQIMNDILHAKQTFKHFKRLNGSNKEIHSL